MKTISERFWAKVHKTDTCWNWTGALHTGYGWINLGYRSKSALAHRVGFQLQTGQDPGDLCVLHHCDNRKCVRIDHLFLGTKEDNIADAVQKQRHAYGERTCGAILNDDLVQMLRNTYATGRYSQRELGMIYGVTQPNIHAIVSRRSWRHV